MWPFPEPRPLWRRGEAAAARHLQWKGFRILARNARFGHNEVDIIARDGDTTVFVEVRTRESADPMPPEDSITYPKRRHLRAAARMYLSRQPDPDQYFRFDVVGVVMPEHGKPGITHYPDAFRMDE